jgi:signal transduction histidine kinase
VTSSFRRRLIAIAALTVVICAAAMGAILFLARAAADDRAVRARDNVTREVEGMRGVLESVPPSVRPRRDRQSGQLQSGYVAGLVDVGKGPLVDEALQQAAARGDEVVLERTEGDDTPVLVAATPVPGGGYVFASQRVVAGRETRGLRVVVLLLALLSFGLVVASLQTLVAVEKGVSTLRVFLAALARDLRTPVARPALRELDEVAGGMAALAGELDRAQMERERLTRELAAQERLAALGRVAAGIAHEVRNPLASMKLRADLARTGGEATPAIARDLEDISSEIARLDRLVSDLLVVAGRRSGPQEEMELGELVAKRVALLDPWAVEKKVGLECEGAARACADADALARAVDNLLRNAVEASPDGARVKVRVGAIGDGARITVTDRGPGIAPERAAQLFEPFFTTKPEGTGLGLALARAVAQAHRGTLTYARQGDSTCFTLTVGPSEGPVERRGTVPPDAHVLG